MSVILKIKDLITVELDEGSVSASSLESETLTGTLHYKYVPKTGGYPGSWGKNDVAYAVLTPSSNSNQVIHKMGKGNGEVIFHPAKWEDLPTQYTIVNTFNQLEIIEYRSATITKTVGAKDLSDQRILL